MSKNLDGTLRNISRGALIFFAVTLPLVAFPWTGEPLEINKQLWLFLATAVVVLTWLAASLVERRIEARFGYAMIAVLVWVGVVGLGSLLSQESHISWLGGQTEEDVSFLTTALLGLLALVMPLLLRGAEESKRLGWALLGSAFLVALLALLPILKINIGIFANTVGAPIGLGYFLLTALSWASAWWLVREESESSRGRILQIALMIGLFIVGGLLLVVLDARMIWWLGLIVSIALSILAFYYAEYYASPGRLVPLVALFFLSAAFLLFQSPFQGVSFAREAAPGKATTIEIAKGTWKDGNFLLGSGPGTFGLGYSKFVSENVNKSPLWDVIFDRGAGQALTSLTTHGLVGVLAFAALLGVIFVGAIRRLIMARSSNVAATLVPPFIAWLVLVVASVVYPTNMTLVVWFWLLTGILLAELLPPAKILALGQSPRAKLATYAAFVLAITASAVVGYVVTNKYLANVAYAKAMQTQDGGTLASIELLNKAATLSPKDDVYYRNLAAALLLEAAVEAQKDEPDSARLQSLLGNAVAVANAAKTISPNDVRNWEVSGTVFRELIPLASDASQASVASYEQAIALWPVNPRLRVELARAYIVTADSLAPQTKAEDEAAAAEASRLQTEALAKAEAALQEAIRLKSDYVLARYYYSFVEERQGKLAEAVRDMTAVRDAAPNDLGVGIQLALLYLRQGKNDLAKAELERLVEIAPNFSNAHWYLSVIYEEEGEIEAAISEVQKVLELNPENTAVKQRLERLTAGAQGGIELPEPVEEIPEETVGEITTP